MKKALSLLLAGSMIFSVSAPTFGMIRDPFAQQLADEAYKIGTEKGLTGDELLKFIDEYLDENTPTELYDQMEEEFLSQTYQERLVEYNEWKDLFYVYSYNSIVLPQETGFIVHNYVSLRENPSDPKYARYEDRYILAPGKYDLITEYTLDGFLLAKTFDGTYSLFSMSTRDFVKTYDKKYDFSLGNEQNLFKFAYKTVYDLTDTEKLRVLAEDPFCIPAKDRTTGKYGFINYMTGEIAIPFIYDGATNFQDGLAAVKKGNLWGYIDGKNNVVLPFKYTSANNFNKGIAQADKSFIDKTGKVMVTTKHSQLYICGSDYYIGFGQYLTPYKTVATFIEVFDKTGKKLRDISVDPPTTSLSIKCGMANDINNSMIKDLKYLGNGKLQLVYPNGNIVVDLTKA